MEYRVCELEYRAALSGELHSHTKRWWGAIKDEAKTIRNGARAEQRSVMDTSVPLQAIADVDSRKL